MTSSTLTPPDPDGRMAGIPHFTAEPDRYYGGGARVSEIQSASYVRRLICAWLATMLVPVPLLYVIPISLWYPLIVSVLAFWLAVNPLWDSWVLHLNRAGERIGWGCYRMAMRHTWRCPRCGAGRRAHARGICYDPPL